MKKVVIPTKLSAVAKERLEDHGNYRVHQEETKDLLTLAVEHADAYAMIVRSEKVTAEVIDAFPELKVLIPAGAGYNTIDIQYARKRGIDDFPRPPLRSSLPLQAQGGAASFGAGPPQQRRPHRWYPT